MPFYVLVTACSTCTVQVWVRVTSWSCVSAAVCWLRVDTDVVECRAPLGPSVVSNQHLQYVPPHHLAHPRSTSAPMRIRTCVSTNPYSIYMPYILEWWGYMSTSPTQVVFSRMHTGFHRGDASALAPRFLGMLHCPPEQRKERITQAWTQNNGRAFTNTHCATQPTVSSKRFHSTALCDITSQNHVPSPLSVHFFLETGDDT